MSSVGSLLACPTLLATLALCGAPVPHQVAAYAIVALVIVRHRQNIGRLFAGQENRVGS
jgi:glycerol-3-phosphate acyltransferase PlsY